MEPGELKQTLEKFNAHLENIEAMLRVSHELKEIRSVAERLNSHMIAEQTIVADHGIKIELHDKMIRGDAEQKELGDHRKLQIIWKFYKTFDRALMFLIGLGASELIHFVFK